VLLNVVVLGHQPPYQADRPRHARDIRGRIGLALDCRSGPIGDKFPKHIYHSIVCIGALIAHWELDHWAVDAVGAPPAIGPGNHHPPIVRVKRRYRCRRFTRSLSTQRRNQCEDTASKFLVSANIPTGLDCAGLF
jgi:hypothetical protein